MSYIDFWKKFRIDFSNSDIFEIFSAMILVSFVFAIMFVVLIPNENEFSLTTAQYTYSAIFQGFAAILAITITIALVSLQSIGTQISTFEDRVFKMIHANTPAYRITSMKDIDIYIKTKFESDFRKELIKKNQEGDISSIVIEISDEITRLFRFIEIIENNDKSVRRYFGYSLSVSIIVLIFSLIALVFTADENAPTEYFKYEDLVINQYTVLYAVFFTTTYGIISSSYFFYRILKAWTTRYNPTHFL